MNPLPENQLIITPSSIPLRRNRGRRVAPIIAAVAIATLASCREVAPAFGPSIPAARTNAEGLFGGIAQRFTNVQRNSKFAIARGKLGRHALTPSGIFNDTSVWTGTASDGARIVNIDGEFSNNRYLFSARPSAPPTDEPGDSRHVIGLKKLTDDEFEWTTNVDISAGRISASDFANVISALMLSAESRAPAAIRADYRASFPRSSAALGRLFSIDTLRTSKDAEGATTITLGFRISPARIKPTMPAFAAYLEKYAAPSKYRAAVTDPRGGRWAELGASDNFITLRLRSIGGRFAPLNGPVRPMPRDLQVTSDFTTKILLFTVGYRNLIGDLRIVEEPRQRGWMFRFTREPEWKLPPAVGYLIKTPLRRPFRGEGATLRLVMADRPGAQTIISRRSATVVQESAILRFLNRLSGTAMGDFVGKAEIEENRFSAEVFNAMRLDARGLLQ